MIFWSLLGWLMMGAVCVLLAAWLVLTAWRLTVWVLGLACALIEGVMVGIAVLLCAVWRPVYWLGELGATLVRRLGVMR